MDIVVDIQGFRNDDAKFIPKEVALLAINKPIVGHWIMTPPCSFGDLPERARRENNWLSRNYHGIEWFDGEADPEYFTQQLREITRCVRYIYSRGHEKAQYLRNLLSRNVYNLEGISPPFKNLPDVKENGGRCVHHGFRSNTKFACALHNAYKLKHWLNTRDNIDSSYASIFSENCTVSEETDSEIFSNRNFNDIEAWRRNNSVKEEEQNKEQEDSSKIVSDTLVVSTTHSPSRENANQTTVDSAEKEKVSEIIQAIPVSRTSARNEFAGNFICGTSTQCQICGGLSCRQTAEGVDEVDGHRC